MKTKRKNLFNKKIVCFIIMLIFIFIISDCKYPDVPVIPTGNLTDYSDCKSFTDVQARDSAPADRDCVFYEYNSKNKVLKLTHVNAGFNCCPGEITADITIKNNIITIKEAETEAGCRCMCLYDLNYEIKGIDAREYLISVVEPYIGDEDDKLDFTVDVSASPSGSYCVERNHYPWESTQVVEEPSGSLVKTSGCNNFGSGNTYNGVVPPDKSCMEYRYDGEGDLSLTHINAGFNCCPEEIVADISIENNVIIIREAETGGLCFCQCLYNLEYEFTNLKPDVYRVQVVEPYINVNAEKLEFTMDLSSSPSGEYCVDRNQYPWSNVTVAEPEGSIVGTTNCKSLFAADAIDSITSAEDCAEYSYDGKGVLSLKQINAGFNCCPGKIIADIQIDNHTIIISEDETEGFCDCLCLYDVDYEFVNIVPGDYRILIRGLYVYEDYLENRF